MPIHAVIQKSMRITDPAIEEEIRTPLCFSESLGHFFGAPIMNEAGTGPADLTGASVTANFIRGDGIYGTINGTVSGNVPYVILPSWCYRATGRFTLTVFLNLGTASRAIIIARGRVMADTTDTAVDPEHIIPSIAELLAQISACISATEAANTAASNANTKAGAADTAAGAANTAASNANDKAALADAAAGKINDMTVAAFGLAAGASPTAQISEVSGHKHIAFGIPKGDKGDTGAQGPKGDPGDVSSVNGISPDGSGNVTIPNATQSAAGMMSAADKTKLDGLPASAAVPGSIAIIVDGDASGMAVAPGQYAYIKNNTHGLAEGLYKNKSSSAFPTSGGTANSTIFEAVPGGGLNSLNSNITKTAINTGITGISAYRASNIIILQVAINTNITASSSGWVNIGTLPQELCPPTLVFSVINDNNASSRSSLPIQMRVTVNGVISVYIFANESVKPYGQIVY